MNHILRKTQCLKITEKVSFNIASEASYVYILSGQKLIKNAKMGNFGEFLKTWGLRSNSVTRQVKFQKLIKIYVRQYDIFKGILNYGFTFKILIKKQAKNCLLFQCLRQIRIFQKILLLIYSSTFNYPSKWRAKCKGVSCVIK